VSAARRDDDDAVDEGILREARVRRVDAQGCEVVPLEGGEPLFARVRGRVHRIGRGERSPLAPGDIVEVRVRGSGSVVEKVRPRRSRFSRESAEGGRPQILAANVDLVVALLPLAEPPPNHRLVDRVLAAACHEDVEGLVVLSKADLVGESVVEDHRALYRGAGVEVEAVSVPGERGVEAVENRLRARTSVVVGTSGAGKSTLLKRILGPAGADIGIGAVNAKTGKGRHTTTASRLLPLPCGGWVVDTPGVRTLALPEMRPADLALLFPEFARLDPCRFHDCTHTVEPDCRAAAEGNVDPRRLDSYRAMVETMRQDAERRGW